MKGWKFFQSCVSILIRKLVHSINLILTRWLTILFLQTYNPSEKHIDCWSCCCFWPFTCWCCRGSKTCIWNGWDNGRCIIYLHSAWSGYTRPFGSRKDGTWSWNCKLFSVSNPFHKKRSYAYDYSDVKTILLFLVCIPYNWIQFICSNSLNCILNWMLISL